MSDWLISIEGTEAGHILAISLALMSAILHAVFGALQKGRFDPWLTRGATDISYGLIILPFALFAVPFPEPHIWPILGGAFLIHTAYKILQAQAYTKGAYTVVYPVVRGTGPLITVLAVGVVFSEHYTIGQWSGVLILSGGILGLAIFNLSHETIQRSTLFTALFLAFLTGVMVAAYTTYDAYGIRATPNPFTFLAWFYVIDAVAMPLIAALRWHRMETPPQLGALMRRGFVGGIIAIASFGGIMLATRLDKVGQAAVLRETSVLFAALIGWLFLREAVGVKRAALMGLIALGAVLVEFGR